ncbi:MAG TPA: sigma-70 family RNA polymerase sigma factor [Polyangiales bacterium]|nr:sigma-70 family RNA polymerase sigma factor [Polyangiales bacterium]
MVDAAATFEPHRPRLTRLAWRMLGSSAEAEDLVQDAYLRWHEKGDREAVLSDEAFLVRMVSRLAIDRLRHLKVERESYYGSWLPEPAPTFQSLGDEFSYAAQVMLECLSPDERLAFLLRELFDMEYAQIAGSMERNEASVRKLVSRARERLAEANHGTELKREIDREAQRALLSQLVAATRAENAEQLEKLMAQTVRMTSDGGGRVHAARYPLDGAARVSDALWRIVRKHGDNMELRLVELDGEPAVLFLVDGALISAGFVGIRDGQVDQLYMVLNPEKLGGVIFSP